MYFTIQKLPVNNFISLHVQFLIFINTTQNVLSGLLQKLFNSQIKFLHGCLEQEALCEVQLDMHYEWLPVLHGSQHHKW